MDDGSVDALHAVRAQTKSILHDLKGMAGFPVYYVQVTVDGALHDAEAVRRYRAEYGIHASVLHLGVLYGDNIESVASSVIEDEETGTIGLPLQTASKRFGFVNVKEAMRALTAVVKHPGAIARTWKLTTHTRRDKITLSEFAARGKQRTHFVFY